MIPFEIGITLDKALDQEEELNNLYEQEEDVRGLIDLARSLEGICRNAGKHAGGVVIAPSKLTDFTPLYCEQGSASTVTQFDKDDVEAVGLVKFDFLGLRTLTIIDWAVKTINIQRKELNEEPLDITMIPMDDALSFNLLKRCATTAVFQLESRGMKELIKRLKPDCFDEIIALVALFRPGPLQSGMVDDFIDRKHGKAVVYPHPELEPILKPTYGVILYQEQVMQIAQVLAGYSLGAADLLRRAMGKKKPEEMAKQRSIFTEGAVKRGVEEKTATYIFDLMEKFAGYGFNKSHSAAYALISYQTTWLKSHYPAAFMAAVLSSDMDNTDKVVTLIYECREMDLEIVAPRVNESDYMFTVSNDGAVIYGLGAIKGVGQAAIENIKQERTANGVFVDLFDFCRRIDMRKANKRVLEALIRSGAMDNLGENRATLMAQLPEAVKTAEQHVRNSAVGIDDLFGNELPRSEEGQVQDKDKSLKLPVWDDEARFLDEKETLGLFLTGHPITCYKDELSRLVTGQIAELLRDASLLPDNSSSSSTSSGYGYQKSNQGRAVLVAGFVMSISTINMRRGKKVVIILDDPTARIEVTLFSEVYEKYKEYIIKNKPIVVQGKLGPDNFASGGYSIKVDGKEDTMYTIDQAYEKYAKQLVIGMSSELGKNGFVNSLKEIFTPFCEGQCPISIQFQGEDAHATLPLGVEWRVKPTNELLHRLRELAGNEKVELMY
jgi:DNA polymerase-3 subunit alpha